MTDATTTGVAAVSPARVVAICAAVSALFAAIGWFALRPVAYTAVGAMADFAFIAIALLLVRPVFRSPARVLLLALALGFTFSFSLVLKSSLLGAPVYSSDLVALVALLGILSGWQWLLAVGVLVLLAVVLAWSLAPRPGRSGWLLAGAAYIAALVLLAPWLLVAAQWLGHVPLEDGIEHYRRDGGVLFLLEDRLARAAEHANAPDAKAVQAARYSVELPQPVVGVRRNVHLVLLESIWDPLKLSAYRFDRDPFDPRFRRLLEASGNSGVLSPVFGSLTANAEFEMLCGMPTSQRAVFFTRDLKQPMPCLPRALRDSGYLAMASHPNHANFWSRDQAYGRIGFEQYRSLPSFVIDDRDGAYLADASMFRQNLQMLAAAGRERPIFNYVVTLSSHYPYHRDRGKRPDRVRVTPDQPLLADYANAAYYTTAAFMDWLEQIHRRDPDALVVAFGDHAPMLGNNPDPYQLSGLPISGRRRPASVLAALSTTPLVVVDGRQGVAALGQLPIKRVGEVIMRALHGQPLPQSPRGMARRFQDNLLVGVDDGWKRCADPSDPADADEAAAQDCAAARKRDRDQRTVRDDLAGGHQFASREMLALAVAPTAMAVDADVQRCFADVEGWGPAATLPGRAFNVQAGGLSATWLRAPRRAGAPRLRIGNDEAPIKFGEDIGSAAWREPAFLAKAGRYPVDLLCDGHAPRRLGYFQVGRAAPPPSVAAAPPVATPARTPGKATQPPTVPVALSAEAAAALVFKVAADDGRSIDVDPPKVLSAQCLAGRVWRAALRLHWKGAPTLREVEVTSTGPTDAAPTLFARSGPVGGADTGEWVRDGQRFDFTDASSGKRLRSLTLSAPACQ